MLIATLKIAMTFRHVSTEKINLKGHNSLLKKKERSIFVTKGMFWGRLKESIVCLGPSDHHTAHSTGLH